MKRAVDRAWSGRLLVVPIVLAVCGWPGQLALGAQEGGPRSAERPGREGRAEHGLQLACTPRWFQVLPGEPVRVELTVVAPSAAAVRLHVPAHPLLLLRAVEKLPVQRNERGAIVHRRVVIWQGLEPGTAKMNAIAVETAGRKLLFPEITITVRDPGP